MFPVRRWEVGRLLRLKPPAVAGLAQAVAHGQLMGCFILRDLKVPPLVPCRSTSVKRVVLAVSTSWATSSLL